jgi:hypothetical protein
MTRTTGILLSVFILFPMLLKLYKTKHCCRIFKYLMASWFCALFILLPAFVVQIVVPYEMHCDPKIDRTNAVPVWCLDSLPNLYSHIQTLYWDNRLFGFMYRQLDNFLVSLPTFIVIAALTVSLSKELWSQSQQWTVSAAHLVYLVVSMLLVLLYANTDINGRVASAIPLYFWASGSRLSEQGVLQKVINLHNLGYMVVNFVIYPMEVGFI